MVMSDTCRELLVTTRNGKAFALRLSPSNRAFRVIRTHKYGKPEQRAIKTADAVAQSLERIDKRGYFTKYERDMTIVPFALCFSEKPPVKYRGKVVYTRGLDKV